MFGIEAEILAQLAVVAQAAPEVADKPVSSGCQLGLTIYEMLATLVTGAIVWLTTKGSAWIKTKINNETVGGIVSRFMESIGSAVRCVNQTIKDEILKAKDPKSTGGVKITESEAKKLKDAVWESLKSEYGGMDGISKLLGVIGITGDSGVKKWIDDRIESAVNTAKLEEKVAGTSGP